MSVITACGGGYQETSGSTPVGNAGGSVPVPGGQSYTWLTAKADCGTCHASAAFMASEAEFKSFASVINQVVAGTMPKGNPYNSAKIAAFKAYMSVKN